MVIYSVIISWWPIYRTDIYW